MQKRLTLSTLVGVILILTLIAAPVSAPAWAAATVTRTPPALNSQLEGDLLTGIWPRAMAFDSANNVWVLSGFENNIIRIDEGTGSRMDDSPIKAARNMTALAWLDKPVPTMWVASYDDKTLTPIEIDQGAPKVGSPVSLGTDKPPVAMVAASGFLWVLVQSEVTGEKDGLLRFNPGTGQVDSKLTVGTFPTAITASDDGRYLWVANGNDDSVSMIDTREDSGKGKVIATFSKDIPAFPITLAFDGGYLWVGGYECVYVTENEKSSCKESTVGRFNAVTGEPAPTGLTLPGRQVSLSTLAGNMWVSNAHKPSFIDINTQNLQTIDRRPVPKLDNTDGSYLGSILMGKKFVYVADWVNDRVIRIRAPGAIPILPTPSALPATTTPLPTEKPTDIPQCNPDPKFPPRLRIGDKGKVVDDKFKVNVFVRTARNFSEDSKIKPPAAGLAISPGKTFTVLDGPFTSDDSEPEKVCFYEVQTESGKQGFITEGGLASDKDDKRYYIEPAK